jgi:hypothetical protein
LGMHRRCPRRGLVLRAMTRPILTLLLLASLSANGALFTLPKPPVVTSRVTLEWETP